SEGARGPPFLIKANPKSSVKNAGGVWFRRSAAAGGVRRASGSGHAKAPRATQEQAEVIAGGSEHGVHAVAVAALEDATNIQQRRFSLNSAHCVRKKSHR